MKYRSTLFGLAVAAVSTAAFVGTPSANAGSASQIHLVGSSAQITGAKPLNVKIVLRKPIIIGNFTRFSANTFLTDFPYDPRGQE